MSKNLPPVSAPKQSSRIRTVTAVAVGNMMEWYDFGLYAFLAVYLAPNFFGNQGEASGVLDILLVFGIAFLFRPLGGLILGPMGDRRGRLFSLIVTFMGMAVATCAVGLTPSESSVGWLAPVLLVTARAAQGFFAGGESGIALTYLTERAPSGRRAFYSSFVQASSITGFLLASFITWLVTSSVSQDQMHSWGWRIPFLLAIPFGAIGMYMRWRLEESEEFVAVVNESDVVASPTRTAVLSNRRVILAIAAVSAFQNVGYYTAFGYFSGYMQRLGFSDSTVSRATTITLAVAAISVPLFGLLSDRIGRRKVLLTASGAALILTLPLFSIMGGLGLAGVIACQIVLALTVAAYNSTTGATYAEMTETRTRSGAVTIGFNLGSLTFAAPTLYVMTYIETHVAATWAPGAYMALAALISVAAVISVFRLNMVRDGLN